jgi:Tol biopolymer transport system component
MAEQAKSQSATGGIELRLARAARQARVRRWRAGLIGVACVVVALWWVVRIRSRPWEIVVGPLAGPVPAGRLLMSAQTVLRHVYTPATPNRAEEASPAGGSIVLVEPATGKTRTLVDRVAYSASLSPDGRRLAYCTDDQDLWIYDIQRGQSERLAELAGGRPLWTPDSSALIFTRLPSFLPGTGGPDAKVRLDLATRKATLLPIAPTEELADISPDGRWLLTTSSRHFGQKPGFQIYLVSLDGSEERRLTAEGFNLYPRFAPDGRSIVFTLAQKREGSICLMNADSTGVRTILRGLGASTKACFTPDGSHILLRDEATVELADADGSNRRPISVKSRFLGVSLGRFLDSNPLWLGAAEWVPAE